MKKYAIIVAAGSGSRMGGDIPKQFIFLKGKPVYSYSVDIFLRTFPDIEILLVIPKDYDRGENALLAPFEKRAQIKIIRGSETRFGSVKNALNEINDDGIVFIHDGVRPLIGKKFLERLLATAIEKGNVIPCIDIAESLRLIEGEKSQAVNRNFYKAIQTPQVFDCSLIKKAYEQEYREVFTDDASVLEATGIKINLVEGMQENIKITRPSDLQIAAALLNR